MSTVAICCNGPIPGCGFPNSAQGIRALGLYHGLRAHGVDCRIVSPADTVHGSMVRWAATHVRIPEYWHVLPTPEFARVLNQKYGTVIFLNWSLGINFRKGENTRVIYDFFSPTIVEHSFIKDRGDLNQKIEAKLSLVRQADAFIANGVGRAEYALDFLSRWGVRQTDTEVVSVPLGVPWQGEDAPRPVSGRPKEIFIGGFEQIWTKGLSIGDVVGLARRLHAVAHVIGVGEHFHFGRLSQEISAGDLPENVLLYRPAAFETYCDINRRCDVALDVFSDNEERRVSYSTRSIVSIANGCPIVHMGFTEVGGLLGQIPAGWTLDQFNLGKLESLLAESLADDARLTDARQATYRFWQQQVDPVRQVEPMLRLLQ